MRKLITAALMVAATNATAQLPSCDVVAKMAGFTMMARQSGVPAAKQVEMVNAQFPEGSEDRKLITAVILLAKENKRQSITEFESEIFVACLKSRKY